MTVLTPNRRRSMDLPKIKYDTKEDYTNRLSELKADHISREVFEDIHKYTLVWGNGGDLKCRETRDVLMISIIEPEPPEYPWACVVTYFEKGVDTLGDLFTDVDEVIEYFKELKS